MNIGGDTSRGGGFSPRGGGNPPLPPPPRHYLRTHAAGEPVQSSEHAIEREIVSPAPHAVTTSCLGGRLVDAVNALPLAKDEQGGRAGNIEADMLLLVEEKEAYRQLLVEVKSTRDHAWYATVELLRQL